MSQNDRVLKLRKFLTVLVGLVMIISGMIITTMSVGAGGRGSRFTGPDADNTTNDWEPDIAVNNNPATVYENDAMVLINITVVDADEMNMTSYNGTNITSVQIKLDTISGLVDDWQDMTYNTDASVNSSVPDFDEGMHHGFWHYTIDLGIAGAAAGDYLIWFNATDGGLNETGTIAMWNNTVNFTIKVSQVNRAPEQRAGGNGGVFSYSVAEDSDVYEFDLNDTVFSDDDIAFGPFPNTVADALGFTFWDGAAWKDDGAAAVDFGNFTVVFNTSMSIMVTPNANMYTLPAGEDITFNCTDGDSESVEVDVTIIITAANDMPMLYMADMWMFNNLNATFDDEMTILCEQGKYVDINVNASDIDGDTLMYSTEAFNGSTTALTEVPFTIDEDDGNITFTPDNDAVGMFNVTVNVTDGTDYDMHYFHFITANVNDLPTIGMKINDVVQVITDNMIALTATQDTKFMAVITGMDIDMGDTLTFKAGSTTLDMLSNTSADYNMTPTNDDVGEMEVNFTVTDGTATDYVVATITVNDVNDAPDITSAKMDSATQTIVNDTIDLTGTPIITNATVTFEIMADDIDFDIPAGEVLSWMQKETSIPATAYNIVLSNDNMTATIEFYPTRAINGTHTLIIEVADDGGSTDIVNIMIDIAIPEPPPERDFNKPTITITTQPDKKYELAATVTIEGTWADIDNDTVTVKVEVLRPSETASEFYTSTYVTTNADGTWTFTYDLPIRLGKLLGVDLDKPNIGTWTFIFVAEDDSGDSATEQSAPQSATTKVEKTGEDDDDAAFLLGMGLMLCLLIILIPIILLIVIIVLLMSRKKKRRAAAEMPPPPEEGMAPPPEMTCPACGAMIPAGAETCPGCGAAAPVPEAPPEEGMPPEGMEAAPPAATCATCGSEIPAESPTCVACGAPAPPPEAPPEEGMAPPPEEGMAPPEEGMMPPAEEGMPPAEAPPEGMPPEQPPAEAPPEGMPPEQPPAEMPPEQPPAEAPPQEQAAAPPAGMATCPQCGGQLAVGTTPCPSCGAALNW